MNYRKIADGFSLALSDIGDHLRSVKATAKIADTAEMRRLVVELYVEVFELLCRAMSWFVSRKMRFKAALRKNFYDNTVKKLEDRIQKTVRLIRDEAELKTQGYIQEIHETITTNPELLDRLRPVGNWNRRDDTAEIYEKLNKMQEQLGYLSASALGSVEQRQTYRETNYHQHTIEIHNNNL